MIKLIDILYEIKNKPSREDFEQEYGWTNKSYDLTDFLTQHQNDSKPLEGKTKEQFLSLIGEDYPNIKKLIEKSNSPIYTGDSLDKLPHDKNGQLDPSSFNLVYDFGGYEGPIEGNNVVVVDSEVDTTTEKEIQADLTEPLEQLPPADAINMTHAFNNMSIGTATIVAKNINQSLKPGGILFIADSLSKDLDDLFKSLSSYKVLSILINDSFDLGGYAILVAVLQK